MKFECPLITVKDMEVSKTFYRKVLGLRVTSDLGANVVLTGGLALQSEESWLDMMLHNQHKVHYHGNDGELCFEETDFDGFLEHLTHFKEIEYVHPVKEHDWGQRVIRFYDPDGHIIEVGEAMKVVTKRFLATGMSLEEVAKRMDVPLGYVKRLSK